MCECITRNFNGQHHQDGKQQEVIEGEKACPLPGAVAAWAKGGAVSREGYQNQGKRVYEVEKREQRLRKRVVEAGSWEWV